MERVEPNKTEYSATELKILEAAKKVFQNKGYGAARTRDIAAEAGINLALLNYYFRSKQYLFKIIMYDSFKNFVGVVFSVVTDESLSLEEKIKRVVNGYTDLLIKEPEIATFILTELRNHPEDLIKVIQPDILMNSSLMKQFKEAQENGTVKQTEFIHFMVNTVSLTVFPFVGMPIVKMLGAAANKSFEEIINERRELIPQWIKTMESK